MRKIKLGKTKEKIPVMGQGTWGVKKGKDKTYYEQWKASLCRGVDLGLTHLDTAEVYGGGAAERVVGEVIKQYKRDDLFITSKLFPTHLSEKAMRKAVDRTLQNIGISCLDLYLIHWPSPFIPVQKHVRVLEGFAKAGKTRYIGMSNHSVARFQRGQDALKETDLVNNQLHLNITRQKHVALSLPYYQQHDVTVTAYSPLGHWGYKEMKNPVRPKLQAIAEKHKATIQEICLAWLVNLKGVITIPKAFQVTHVESNARAADIRLSDSEMKDLTVPAPVEWA